MIIDSKSHQVNEPPPPINQLEVINDLKIEEAPQTAYVASARKAEKHIEQETEADSTGYEVAHEVAMSNDASGYDNDEDTYLESPEEDEAEVLEVGDRIVEILSGIKGVVVGFKDGRVVFDCREFGRCSRPAIMLKKI